MILFAIGIEALEQDELFWIKGLTIAALAVVINAVVGMQQKLCQLEVKNNMIAVVAFLILFFCYSAWMQSLVILIGGVLGLLCFRSEKSEAIENSGSAKKWIIAAALVALVAAIPFFSNWF